MIVVTKEEFNLSVHRFRKMVAEGAIFIYPTDTVYGIGCDATNPEAVSRLRRIKGTDKPFSVIAPGKAWVKKSCKVGIGWLKRLPGPYTIIADRKDGVVADNISHDRTLGIRIPDHWISGFVEECGKPIITTSANLTGEPIMTSIDDLSLELRSKVDFMIDEGKLSGRPSTLVYLNEGKVVAR